MLPHASDFASVYQNRIVDCFVGETSDMNHPHVTTTTMVSSTAPKIQY